MKNNYFPAHQRMFRFLFGAVTLMAVYANDISEDELSVTMTLSDAVIGPRAPGFMKLLDTSSYEFYVIVAIVASIVYLAYGATQNKSLAQKCYTTLSPVFEVNFSRVGRSQAGLTCESFDHYSSYASGRVNTCGAVMNILLNPRQDLFHFIQSQFGVVPKVTDTISVEVFLPDTAPLGCILIASSAVSNDVLSSNTDVSLLTKHQPSDNKILGGESGVADVMVYRDSYDALAKLPLASFGKVIASHGLSHMFHSIIFSDQSLPISAGGPATIVTDASNPAAAAAFMAKFKSEELAKVPEVERPTVGIRVKSDLAASLPGHSVRVARLTMKIPSSISSSLWEGYTEILHTFFQVIDQFVLNGKPSIKAMEAIKTERQKAHNEANKEAIELMNEEKKKAADELTRKREDEKLASMTPAERKKYLEKKELKKNKPKGGNGKVMKIL